MNRLDNANRADGALGSPSDGLGGYSGAMGTFVIDGNKIRCSVGASRAVRAYETSVSVGTISMVVSAVTGGSQVGLCARWASDTQYWFCLFAPGSVPRLYFVDAGGHNQVGGGIGSGGLLVEGDFVELEVTAANTWKIRVNGVQCFLIDNAIESSVILAQYSTATQFGIMSWTDTTTKLDDIAFFDPAAAAGPVITGPNYYYGMISGE